MLGTATRSLRPALVLGALLGTLALSPHQAKAETSIAADVDFNVPIDENLDTGGGFGLRLGYELHLPLIVLNPEVGFTYTSLSGRSPTIYRGIAGGRLGFGELLRFGVLAHVGFGYLDGSSLVDRTYDVPRTSDLPEPLDRSPNYVGFSFDAGVFIDFTLVPLLNIGVHGIFNQLAATTKDHVHFDAVNWMQLGVHLQLVL